ncbi:MAG: CPBP family intramembrane metalloprotease [Bacteroidetes bacterium]|nr:CPBP family intramembrane metalloprotease [Bacteroidota bacterium]
MKTTSRLNVILTVLITFGVYFTLDVIYFNKMRAFLNGTIDQIGVSHLLAYTLSLTPLILGAYLLQKSFKKTLESLGLNQSILVGFLFCFICTLPMLIGYMFVFEFNKQITVTTILIKAVSSGFFEELIFRGFLFGLLFRYTKLGFILASLLGAMIFGLMHLYQSNDPLMMLGIFGVTFSGSLFFGWAYAEWKYNIWVPVFLHLLMNLYFELFSAGENALGGVYMNIFRITVILLVIITTIYYKRKTKQSFEVTKNSWWMKKAMPTS